MNIHDFWKQQYQKVTYLDSLFEYPELQTSEKKLNNKTFPSPNKVKEKYPSKEIYKFTNEVNECAVRLSVAFLDNNIDISGSKRWRPLIKTNDGRMVQPSASSLADWLSVTIGNPKIYTNPSRQWIISDFINKEGLIYFAHSEKPNRGGDGPGHIDVIANKEMGDYFYNNSKIWFWEWKDGLYIKNKN